MPKGAQILTVQAQHDIPCIWALVEPKAGLAEEETRKFRMFGTGHEIHDHSELFYIGTFQLNDGAFIGHLFEEGD